MDNANYKDIEKLDLSCITGRVQINTAIVEKVKLTIHSLSDSEILLLHFYPSEMKPVFT